MFLITADDYGASLGYSEKVLELISEFYINSVSIIVNLDHFELLAKKLGPYLGTLKVNCHLNLFEGKPLVLSNKSTLVNVDGYFCHNIKTFSYLYLSSSIRIRKAILADVRAEFLAQINAFQAQFPDLALNIDSHQHVHLVPFVFPIVNDLGVLHNFSSIRLGKSLTAKPSFSVFFTIRKNVFNLLSHNARKLTSIPPKTEFILGVNELNRWSESMFLNIKKMIRANPHLSFELVAHPGWKEVHEISTLDPQSRFARHYTSPDRQVEYSLLKKYGLNELFT